MVQGRIVANFPDHNKWLTHAPAWFGLTYRTREVGPHGDELGTVAPWYGWHGVHCFDKGTTAYSTPEKVAALPYAKVH